jgi:hypothetical protein
MKISTTVSLDEEILEAAKGFAKSERRSLSAQIEVWIAEKLDLPGEEMALVGESINPNADLSSRDVVRVHDVKGGSR